MNNIDFIQLNKFSELHNGSSIFFCKTDFLLDDFATISKIEKPIILISGNSDYAITDDLIRLAPPNIKVWYAQNALSSHDILQPLPIGLENKLPSIRVGHGIGYYDRALQRESILSRSCDTIPNKSIYANFNISTNIRHRGVVQQICLQSDHIDWEEPQLSFEDLYVRYAEYRMILCPFGNGIDTHRLWEVLYCNRIPITIKAGPYKIYKLYEQLPIIVLDNIMQLKDVNYLEYQYDQIIKNKYNYQILYTNFWKNQILQHLGV